MIDRLLIAGLFGVAIVLVLLHFVDDGMATCQQHHSFDVCYASLN